MTTSEELKIDAEPAKRISDLLLKATAAMSESVQVAKEQCSPEFQQHLKEVVAEAVADIGWQLLEGIYRQYPDLRPYKLKRDGG